MLQMVDKKIIEKIGELVGEGVRYVEEMKRHLNVFVKDDLFRGKQQPERSNRRYFPKGRTIKNHMYNATIKSRLSAIDQDNVEEMISLWKNEERRAGDKFYFRPYNEGSADVPTSTDEDHDIDDCEDVIEDEQIVTKAKRQDGRLLFIHQTAWQSRLLARYGQDLSFLDATYKTTKYSLPLFFVAVKTNVDYAIVGSFIVQDETTESITEALSIIRQWNPQWKPRYFMTDLCEEEINSIESVFPGKFNIQKTLVIFEKLVR